VPAPWCGPYSLGRTLKPEREAGTAGVAVLNRNARHMRVGNAPYDCKAEARASRLTAIMTPKTTKQKFTLVLVYSRTLIKDPNGSIRSHDELNNRSPRGMMNCILDKIANSSVLSKGPAWADVSPGAALGDFPRQRNLSRCGA
jgi:hypothetical protein